ncbi:MAG: hypothetical protein US63_C0006G0022 [Candidatus Moranbacteria bacterium GW2011_GWC2_37_8]|nr:MAG: hypothetical protein US63_C0006G0022 [Candidatus Moranbacteria bacterium GW2011_GWC2_37_8]KKQ62448.1 MAG: hypothetical protein US82_C0011G0022 [Parcubacteria group bacterium GW2011_GWC1_38_22]KKQ81401.1 MAG: hypothetical protein UT03_C0003G0010 [Candidatus Moranbacteria bacterium GW2011_GWD2_38_7]
MKILTKKLESGAVLTSFIPDSPEEAKTLDAMLGFKGEGNPIALHGAKETEITGEIGGHERERWIMTYK